jgi:hypothetical protein
MARIPTRRTALIVAVCVAALAAGAIVVRASGPGDESADLPPPPRGTPSTPSTDPDDASLTPTVVASTTVERGMVGDVEIPVDPSGARSDRSEDGARQAALDYLVTVRQRLVYLTPEAGNDVLTAWAAPGVSAASISRDVDEAAALRGRLAEDGGQVWWVVSPLAIRVDAYSPERVRVAVWQTSVIASGADPDVSAEATQPMVRFQTDTVELVWDVDRWAVWAVTSTDGPTPMLAPSLGIATPDAFLSTLDGFGLIRRHEAAWN